MGSLTWCICTSERVSVSSIALAVTFHRLHFTLYRFWVFYCCNKPVRVYYNCSNRSDLSDQKGWLEQLDQKDNISIHMNDIDYLNATKSKTTIRPEISYAHHPEWSRLLQVGTSAAANFFEASERRRMLAELGCRAAVGSRQACAFPRQHSSERA